MKIAILVFPGSNCDQDLANVLNKQYKAKIDFIWHNESFDPKHDIYFIPGGFSYGDYLRSGAIASKSKCIQSLQKANEQGRSIIGICNGFQILTESHILPGALIRNTSLKHICKWVHLQTNLRYSKYFPKDYKLPISHSEGNYICDKETLEKLREKNQILFQYSKNPNGSIDNIAGIIYDNVIGLMPHPERAVYKTLDMHPNNFNTFFFDFIFSHL